MQPFCSPLRHTKPMVHSQPLPPLSPLSPPSPAATRIPNSHTYHSRSLGQLPPPLFSSSLKNCVFEASPGPKLLLLPSQTASVSKSAITAMSASTTSVTSSCISGRMAPTQHFANKIKKFQKHFKKFRKKSKKYTGNLLRLWECHMTQMRD